MPSVNIPASVRFGLYLLSAFGSVFVAYAFAKGYIGDAETACWAGLVAVVNGIAAANTNLTGSVPVLVHGEGSVERAELEDGQINWGMLAFVACAVIVIIVSVVRLV